VSSSGTCASCGRAIDAAARLCPYCGADPATGERVVDTQAILQEVFHPREISTSESVLEFARQRQGIVIAVSVLVAFVILALLHQFVTRRNANVVTNSPAVPLTEITDVANQEKPPTPVPMPELDFPYEGHPQSMRTFIVERGAVAPAPPAPPVAANPAAAGAAAAPLRPAAAPQRPQPR
jgi:hypothetical protein